MIVRRTLLIGLAIVALATSFAIGIVNATYELPPFKAIQNLWRRLDYVGAAAERSTNGIDPISLIRIHDGRDVLALREALSQLVWGGDGFPAAIRPDRVDRNIDDRRYHTLSGLGRIDRLTTNMEFGINSIGYHFLPVGETNRLAIYHQGHRGDFEHGIETIGALLGSGYAVIALSMPLLGLNNQPVVEIERLGRVELTTHAHMQYLNPSAGHPLRYFLDPIAAAVNYASAEGYGELIMVGLSGGGWATTVYSALDPRIKRSYPVAGTLPVYLDNKIGDFEQSTPDLLETVNYFELYVMGSYGEGRKQMQILNLFDPCCSPGTAAGAYDRALVGKMNQLGHGTFEIFVDDTHYEHKISEAAIERILADLGH